MDLGEAGGDTKISTGGEARAAGRQSMRDPCMDHPVPSLPGGEETFEYRDVVVSSQEKFSDMYTQLEKLGE